MDPLEGTDPLEGAEVSIGAVAEEAVGRIFKRNPKVPVAHKPLLKQAAAEGAKVGIAKQKAAYNVKTRGGRFIDVLIDKMPIETQKQIKNKSLKTFDATLYFRKAIQGGNDFYVLEESSKKIVGVNSIDNNYLPDRQNMAIQGVSVALGLYITQTNPLTLTDNSPALPVYSNFIDPSLLTLSPQLQGLFNGEINMMAEDNILYQSMLAEHFCTEHSQQTDRVGRRFIPLEALRLLMEKQLLKIQVRFPPNFALPLQNPLNANEKWNWFIEVAIKGQLTKQNVA